MSPKWVTLEKYCDLTGESAEAIRCRRKKGIWTDGYHSKVVARHIWVNYEAAQAWVQQSQTPTSLAA